METPLDKPPYDASETVIDAYEAAVTLLELHDACICCILAHLSSASDLAKVQAVCRRLRNVGVTNELWFKWLYADFGLVMTAGAPAAASTSCPSTATAQLFYRHLRTKKARHALHVEAISTDGSCDEPYEAYWADNMFTYKRSVMYCSASDTKDVHVFGRLCPEPQPLPAPQQQLTVSPVALSESQKRAFLLDRCTRVAVRLIHPDAYEAYHAELQQSGQSEDLEAQAAATATAVDRLEQQGGFLGMLLRRITGSTADVEKATYVRSILNTCSTEGLVEFFLECFIAQTEDKPWSAPLYSGLDDDGLQMVRWVAFNEYQNALAPRSQHRLETHKWPPGDGASQPAQQPAEPALPRPSPQPVSGGVASQRGIAPLAADAAGSRTLAQQRSVRRKQRQLLCADEQLQKLMTTASPAANLCLMRECIFARDGVGGSTCPISSGILYLAHYYNPAQPAAHVTHPAAQQSDDDTAEGASPAVAVQVLGQLTEQPWVSASDGLTTALAVLTACAAGNLPAMLDYACNQQAEWVEFVQPTREQIREQWQLQQQAATDGGSSSGSGDGAGGAGSSCVLCPVLWFRFYLGQHRLPTDMPPPETDEAAVMLGGMPGPNFNADEAWEGAPDLDDPTAPTQEGPAAGCAPEAQVLGDGYTRQQWLQHLQQQLPQKQPQQPHAAGPLSMTAAASAAPTPGARIVAARAAARNLKPRRQSGTPLCEAAPDLPVACSEVSAALGYLPTSQQRHHGYLTVQLKQPRAANLVCMKLLSCEDVQPEFNHERGGCNIDMQLLMLRGHELEHMPAGLAITGMLT